MWYFLYLVRALDIAYYLTALLMGVGSYLVLMSLRNSRRTEQRSPLYMPNRLFV